MANRWLQHLAQFRRNNKNVSPKEMMKKARMSYQNGGKPLNLMKSPAVSAVNKTVSHAAKVTNNAIKKGGNVAKPMSPSPYVNTASMHHDVKGALDPINMRGGGVVPFEPSGTDSVPARVGGRRTRRQSRKSRRTRRR